MRSGACCSGDPKSACDPGLAGPSSGSGSGLPDTRTEEFAVGTAPDAPFGFVASSTPFVAPAAPGEGAHPAEQGKAMCLARSHLEHRSLLDIYSSPHMVSAWMALCCKSGVGRVRLNDRLVNCSLFVGCQGIANYQYLTERMTE